MFDLIVRRTLLLSAALLGTAATPAAAAAPRADDFSVRVASARQTVTAPQPFQVFGFRWREASRGAHVEARVRTAGGRWRKWVEVHGRHSARSSDPVWAGGARQVQLRVHGRMRGLRAHFVSVATPRGARAAAAAPARRQAPGQPPMVPRADWAGDQCTPRDTPSLGTVQAAFVHHTVNANDYGPEDSAAMVLGICRFHRNTNGWDDIGYNFLVDQYGTIFEGRAGGVDQPIVGAQAQGYNAQSTGVANLGTYESVPQTPAAMDAMAKLIAWKLTLHGVPVTGQVALRSAGGESNKHPSGAEVTFERISGHRDGNKTSCPGNALYAQLPDLRARADRVAPDAVPPAAAGALTVAAVRSKLVFPEPARLSGVLTGADGKPLSTQQVDVQVLTAKGFKTVVRATSDAEGRWAADLPTSRNRVIRAVARTGAQPTVSPRVSVSVTPELAARAAASRVKAGRRVLVRGTVRPSKGRVVVEAARMGTRGVPLGRPLRVVARARSRAFTVAVPLVRPGLYRLRVRVAGDSRTRPARFGDLYVRAIR